MIKDDTENKIPAEMKAKLEGAVTEAKGKLESENGDELKAAFEALQAVAHEIAQATQQAPGDQPGPDMGAGPQPGADAGAEKKDDDDVVDADFKEV